LAEQAAEHTGGGGDQAEKVVELERALRDKGVRITRQRAALLSVLAAAEDHPDATELHRRAREIDASVSLSTVYRTLSLLEGQSVVQRHAFEGAPSRFETADAPHHDHIIDLETGDVIEFYSERIERLQAEIAAEHGFELVHHRMELYCRKAGPRKAGPRKGAHKGNRKPRKADRKE
jgi:Fur family ferric uptake transcriptional regulator